MTSDIKEDIDLGRLSISPETDLSKLESLPLEVRQHIYSSLLTEEEATEFRKLPSHFQTATYTRYNENGPRLAFATALFRVNKRIGGESLEYFQQNNGFMVLQEVRAPSEDGSIPESVLGRCAAIFPTARSSVKAKDSGVFVMELQFMCGATSAGGIVSPYGYVHARHLPALIDIITSDFAFDKITINVLKLRETIINRVDLVLDIEKAFMEILSHDSCHSIPRHANSLKSFHYTFQAKKSTAIAAITKIRAHILKAEAYFRSSKYALAYSCWMSAEYILPDNLFQYYKNHKDRRHVLALAKYEIRILRGMAHMYYKFNNPVALLIAKTWLGGPFVYLEERVFYGNQLRVDVKYDSLYLRLLHVSDLREFDYLWYVEAILLTQMDRRKGKYKMAPKVQGELDAIRAAAAAQEWQSEGEFAKFIREEVGKLDLPAPFQSLSLPLD